MTEAEKIICRLYLEDLDKNHTCNEYRLLMELLNKEPCEDAISRQAAIDAIELITWYHQNRNREMVQGANSQEDQAWYKAEDVYKVLNDLPSAQPDWNEMIVICDCCGHAIHVKRQYKETAKENR